MTKKVDSVKEAVKKDGQEKLAIKVSFDNLCPNYSQNQNRTRRKIKKIKNNAQHGQ